MKSLNTLPSRNDCRHTKKRIRAGGGAAARHACKMRNESVVQEVVALVALVRSQQARLEGGGTLAPAELVEVFEDIVCQCDTLMSSMLSCPLTGRMHLDPSIGLTQEECAQSLADALRL